MVWIKICGITNLEDAERISELGVDAVGFVLSADSPRKVETITAYNIIGVLRAKENKISMVGVFVNEEIWKVLKDSESLKLDYIQLSGDEDRDYLKKYKLVISELEGMSSMESLYLIWESAEELREREKEISALILISMNISFAPSMLVCFRC